MAMVQSKYPFFTDNTVNTCKSFMYFCPISIRSLGTVSLDLWDSMHLRGGYAIFFCNEGI